MQVLKGKLVRMLLLGSVFFGGCETAQRIFGQSPEDVFIREPGMRMYEEKAIAGSNEAENSWEYAMLSGNVYLRYWKGHNDPAPWKTSDEEIKLCQKSVAEGEFPLKDWKPWTDISENSTLSDVAHSVGLYVEVWEKASSSSPVVAVVFRGTDASWTDWRSNLRWILRFVPFYSFVDDQYTVVANEFAKEFLDLLAEKIPDTKGADSRNVRIIATGHSLGGGLAQHFAYALPSTSSDGSKLPRVSHVSAFDPSPVTGWYSVKDEEQRETNARGLKIDRIFEHGEALAYIRLLLSYVNPPSEVNPSVREVRYNYVQSWNPFKSHSIRMLACNLMNDGIQAAEFRSDSGV